MIRIFTGEDRVRAGLEINKILGEDHETIDCADLTPADLPPIFLGMTVFSSKRRILLRDFTTSSAVYKELPKYLNTPHEIIMLEAKLDKRSAMYKEIKDKVEIREFKLPEAVDFRQVFDIYKVAKRDGVRAVKMLEGIKINEEPIRFAGLLISQVLKDYKNHPGIRERAVLKRLSTADMQMKSSKIDPWLIVESFLLELSSI